MTKTTQEMIEDAVKQEREKIADYLSETAAELDKERRAYIERMKRMGRNCNPNRLNEFYYHKRSCSISAGMVRRGEHHQQ